MVRVRVRARVRARVRVRARARGRARVQTMVRVVQVHARGLYVLEVALGSLRDLTVPRIRVARRLAVGASAVPVRVGHGEKGVELALELPVEGDIGRVLCEL